MRRAGGREQLEGDKQWMTGGLGTSFVNGNSEDRKDGGFAVFPQGSHPLCLPDLFQALVTEPSHNAVGCASLQCRSCAGGTQTEIQPFNVART